MGKEKSLGSRHFSNNKVFVRKVTHIAPHGEIFHKHFKKVIVVNRFLEFLQIGRLERRLAEHPPVDRIQKGNIVGRRLATITDNAFPESLLVFERALAWLEDSSLFRRDSIVSFYFGILSLNMSVAKGQ